MITYYLALPVRICMVDSVKDVSLQILYGRDGVSASELLKLMPSQSVPTFLQKILV